MNDRLENRGAPAVVVGVLLILFFYNIYTSSRTLPNLYLADEPIGNLTRDELAARLSDRVRDFESRKILFEVESDEGTTRVESSLADLGIVIDTDGSVQKAYGLGKSGNFGSDIRDKLSVATSKKIPVKYSVNWQKLTADTERLFANNNIPAKNATLEYDGEWKIVPEEPGKTVDYSPLVKELAERISNLSNDQINVTLVPDEPDVRADWAVKALERVKVLENQRIILTFEHDSWRLSGQNLRKILKFYPAGFEEGFRRQSAVLGEQVNVVSFAVGQKEIAELEIGLDREGLDELIGAIAQSVNQETVDATIVFEGERVVQFTPAVDGRKLDGDLTLLQILEKISIDNPPGDETIAIKLPVTVTRARIANEEVNSLGIREVVGRGVSYFVGSIANRVHNVTLGAKRVSGTIVKPGENFSFNKSVGEVSGATGYRQAYVISSGRTVLDDGGGICQVSTTIFRAALSAGLPITARTAHAYRVGYYEQRGFRAGLDATVWAPAVDLIFKNDTQNHLLVQAVVDPSDARLEVSIYGTSDGRRVEQSAPIVSNIKPAPEPRYQDEQTLPKGTVKQVDFAADGATSIFTRKVFKDKELVVDDVFKSVFRPWQAVYLVGTGT